jgi:hypothetical protein
MKRILTLCMLVFFFVFLGVFRVDAHGHTFQTATLLSSNISAFTGTGDVKINAYLD